MADGRLEGKRTIISGAGAGMGRAAAPRCAAGGGAGARVFGGGGARIGLLDIDEAAAAAVAKEIGDGGGDALVLPTDVTDEGRVEASVGRGVEAWGGLDVVVGNAGVQLAGQDDRADRLDLAVWQRTIDINLTGMFLVCKHGLKALLPNGGGAIVFTPPPPGLYGCAPGYDAYSTSKAGVYGLIRVMAADYAKEGIRVNGVVPGYTETPMTAFIAREEHEALLATIPLGRQGRPEE